MGGSVEGRTPSARRCAETSLRNLAKGLRIQDLGFRVSGSGFRVSDLVFRVSGFGFWVPCSVLRVPGFGFRVPGFGFPGSGCGFQVPVSGFGFRTTRADRAVSGARVRRQHRLEPSSEPYNLTFGPSLISFPKS